ncbi:MAG: cobalamin biosynthesis protein, partial [Rhodobacteraceae bacterium]|nr:cobalamin biosynthesis protein [Paracoccaceae bacterium]
MSGAGIMLVALGIDLVLGWPKALFVAIGHPVTWIGRLVSLMDEWLNLEGTEDKDRRMAGVAAALAVILAAALVGGLVQLLLPGGLLGMILVGIVAWPLVAARSMYDHVVAVARPLGAG